MSEITRRRWAFGITSASVAWALALVPAAFLLPVYGTQGDSFRARPGGAAIEVHHGSATLIAVNGATLQLLIVVGLPAVLAAIAWMGLRQLCTRGRFSGRRIATAATVVLAALTVLTGFSIGIEMVPVLGLLIIGRALTPPGPAQPES